MGLYRVAFPILYIIRVFPCDPWSIQGCSFQFELLTDTLDDAEPLASAKGYFRLRSYVSTKSEIQISARPLVAALQIPNPKSEI